MKKSVLLFAGTRPEIIKIAPVHLALRQSPTLKPVFVYTGQQEQIAVSAFSDFGIEPEITINLAERRNDISFMLASLLGKIANHVPDTDIAAGLVQGDTTTTLAGALRCFYSRIPFGHVEAGLRTGNLDSPFPEEGHRRMVSQVARWHFAPTTGNRSDLLAENIASDSIFVTGNTVIDAANHIAGSLPETIELPLLGRPSGHGEDSLHLSKSQEIVLVTAHRRESFDRGISAICQAILRVSQDRPDCRFVFPVHTNPVVRNTVREILSDKDNIGLVEPTDYKQMIWLIRNSRLIVTDSGGIQEEAPTFGTPTLVTREFTERQEAIDSGVTVLVGADTGLIHSHAMHAIANSAAIRARNLVIGNPYGDGQASGRIVQVLESSIETASA